MLSVHTTFSIAKGKEREFEQAFAALQARVIKSEPGTVGFQLYRSTGSRRDYLLIAHFRDSSARAAHDAGPFRGAARSLYALCDGTPKVAEWGAV